MSNMTKSKIKSGTLITCGSIDRQYNLPANMLWRSEHTLALFLDEEPISYQFGL